MNSTARCSIRLLRRVSRFSGACLFCLLVCGANYAHAYIDPGTGSYVLQLAVAAFLGAAFTIRLYSRKLKAFLSELLARLKRRSRR